jgi:predicted transcriptional regulator
MARKPITQIIEEIKKLLEKESELSIRQISIKVKSQWRTVEKALETMASLGVVKERKGDESNREERLFSLVNKG